MSKSGARRFASVALVGAVALAGCAVSQPADEAASAPATPIARTPSPRGWAGGVGASPFLRGNVAPASAPLHGMLGAHAPRSPLAPPACGNGVVEAGEDCDEGTYAADNTACSASCRIRDLVVPRDATPDGGAYARSLGAGRHPIATRASDFGLVSLVAEPTPHVEFRMFNAHGLPWGPPVVVDANAPSDASPSLAVLPNGTFLIVWTDFGVDERDIAMRTFDPATGALGARTHANQMTTGAQYDADAVSDGATVAVAWTDGSDPASGPDIRYQLFNATSLAPTLPVAPGAADPALAATPAVEGSVAIEVAASNVAGNDFAFVWRDGQADGERLQVAWGSVRQTIGAFTPGATGDRPAIRALDATHLFAVYSEGTDPTNCGVANVPRLRGVIVDSAVNAPAPSPFWVLAPPAFGQDQPALTGSQTSSFLAWREAAQSGDPNGDELEVLRLDWNGVSLNGGASPLGAPTPLPRWSAHQTGDQRLPALAMSTLAGPALVSAWVDLGLDFTSAEGEGDIAFQIAPLPLTRNASSAPPEPAPALWSRLDGNSSAYINAWAVVATPDANVVVAFDVGVPSFDFGCGPLDPTVSTAIVKFAATDGHCLWSRGIDRVGTSSWAYVYTLVADDAGDVYAAGGFLGTINVAGALTSSGDADALLMKLSGSDGSVRWANGYGGPSHDDAGWRGIDVRNGVVAFTGDFTGSGNFGGANLTAPGGGYAVVVASYSAATGAQQWERVIAGTSAADTYGYAIRVARDGNFLFSAVFTNDIVLGATRLVSRGSSDVALARLDGSNGAPLAVRQIGGPGYDFGTYVLEDAQGNVLVAPWVSNGSDIGNGPIAIQSTNSVSALALFDASLATTLWARVFDAANENMADVALGSGGRIYVNAAFAGSVSFGSTHLTSSNPSNFDGFLAALSSNGDLLWVETRTDPYGSRAPAGLAVGSDDSIYEVDQLWRATGWSEVMVTRGP